MNKIVIFGVSPGSGKSTLARSMGSILKCSVYHLDTFMWKPGWVLAPKEELAKAQQEVMKNREWILEGNTRTMREERIEVADTVIYVEIPLLVCLWNVGKRRIQYHKKVRPDMADGCCEKLDFSFLRYIIMGHNKRKFEIRKEITNYYGSKKHIVILQNKKSIREYLLYLSEKSRERKTSDGGGAH